MMSRKKLSAEALALLYMRSQRGWLQKELAARMGLSDYRQVSRHESGETPLSRETLDAYSDCMGYPPEAVDALLFIYSMTAPDASEPLSPVALTLEERRRIDRAALNAAWTTAANVREAEIVRKRKEKADAARRAAEGLWARLKTRTDQERRDLVAVWPEFQAGLSPRGYVRRVYERRRIGRTRRWSWRSWRCSSPNGQRGRRAGAGG
jgi:transcriptional regulator with XRE-family HTH domain